MWRIRLAQASDLGFLELVLYEAAFWRPDQDRPPLRQAMADPHIRRYIDGWDRTGDGGVIAEDPEGVAVGAAWYRLFDESAPGYGFVDSVTPEISIAVMPGYRGRGVGSLLLTALMQHAHTVGFRALSLSVERDNPARALYERVGFRKVGATGGSWTMRAELEK